MYMNIKRIIRLKYIYISNIYSKVFEIIQKLKFYIIYKFSLFYKNDIFMFFIKIWYFFKFSELKSTFKPCEALDEKTLCLDSLYTTSLSDCLYIGCIYYIESVCVHMLCVHI